MKNLAFLLVLISLPLVAPAFGIEKFTFTVDRGRYWNTSSFKDVYRLYTFRKDVDGNRRESRWLNTFGIAYRHATEGGIFVQPGIFFGNSHFNENRKMGLGGNLLISQYYSRAVQRYASISAFRSFGKEQNSFLKSVDLGLLFSIWEKTKGKSKHGVEMGIGFSLLHVDGNFMPGINFKANAWRLLT